MNEMSTRSDEISALADGALQGPAFAGVLDRMAGDGEAMAQWHAYHVVGDVLRCPDLAQGCTADADFLARLQERLALEPTVVRRFAEAPAAVPVGLVRPAANAFRWKMVAGVASVAAVAALGWNAIGLQRQLQPQVAGGVLAAATLPLPAQPASAAVAEAATGLEGQVMLRNVQLDELLAAHNQAIGGAALQTQAGFVRNANFQEASR